MIYYFSATGNSQHVATRIAEALGTQAQSIETEVRYQLQQQNANPRAIPA